MLHAGVFWTRGPGDRTANRLLAVLFVCASLHLAETFLWVDGLLRYIPFLGSVTYPLVFLVGPLYWLYTNRLVDPTFRLRPIQALHVIPAVVVLASTLPSAFLPLESKLAFFEAVARRDPLPASTWTTFYALLGAVQNLAYLAASIALVVRTARGARERTSDSAAIEDLAMLKRISFGYVAFVAMHLAVVAVLVTRGLYLITIDTIWLLATVAFVNTVAYAALSRAEGFGTAVAEVREARRGAADEAGLRYSRSTLEEGRAESIRAELLRLMDEERPYLEGTLTLRSVARRLGVSTHHLSQVLNQQIGRNFFDFVNDYRVREAQRRLAESDGARTILDVALESGFNNKSTFHQAFKARTGTTPSAWRSSEAQRRPSCRNADSGGE